MIKYKFALIAVLLLLLSCVSAGSDKTEINNKLNEIFSKQQNIYDLPINNKTFSKDLFQKLNAVIKLTKDDQDRIKKSKFPTDKPIILEGSVFSSLYEGYTKYTIKEISISGSNAQAIIDFENNTYNQKWSDKVILIKQNSWKIDNVIYSNKNNSTNDLKQKLSDVVLE